MMKTIADFKNEKGDFDCRNKGCFVVEQKYKSKTIASLRGTYMFLVGDAICMNQKENRIVLNPDPNFETKVWFEEL